MHNPCYIQLFIDSQRNQSYFDHRLYRLQRPSAAIYVPLPGTSAAKGSFDSLGNDD
jgi:hypothetical protein